MVSMLIRISRRFAIYEQLLDNFDPKFELRHAIIPTLGGAELQEELFVTSDDYDKAGVSNSIRSMFRDGNYVTERQDHLMKDRKASAFNNRK